MEVTNGLLANLVETKSMEMVLSPIASQVSQLIIMCESKDGWQPSGRLIQSSESVKHVLMELVDTARRKSDRFNDQAFKSDMETSCELLAQTADNFHTTAVALVASPHNPALRRALIQASKEVLQGTMKLLLIGDESEVKAIGQAAEKVKGQIRSLVTVTTMPQLVVMFKSFTESLVLLTQLATRRQKELVHPKQREKVIMGLGAVKKAVPLLNVALQSYVKHASNAQAKVSRDYAIRQMEAGIRDVTEAVANRFTEDDYLSLEESGFFVSRLDQLLESLTELGRENVAVEFEMWIQEVITHSMSVAHLCTDGQRDVIISNCQRILMQKCRLGELKGSANSGTASEDLKRDYNEVCECLIDDLCDLERHVNLATLDLVVSTFWRTTETLDSLARTAMEQSAHGNDCMLLLNEDVTDFEEHADRVCQVASLAAASSTDARRVRSIRLCIHRLEQLDPEIVPAALACLKSGGDKLAVQHMRLLKQEWQHEFEDLLRVLDDMTDPRIFMDVSQEQLSREVNACNGLLLLNDVKELATMFPSVSGKAARVVQVAKRLIDDHEDPLYRNGLLVYVDRLRKVVVGAGAALSRLLDHPDSDAERETLKRRLQRVPEGVGLVRAALDSHTHPDLLSPLRLQARQTSRGRLADGARSKPSPPSPQSESPTTPKQDKAACNPYLSHPPPYWSAERLKDETRHRSSLSVESGTPKKLSVSFDIDHADQKRGSIHQSGVKQGLKTTGTNTPPLNTLMMTEKTQSSVTSREDKFASEKTDDDDAKGGDNSPRDNKRGSNSSDLGESPRLSRKGRSLSPALRPRVSKSPESKGRAVHQEPGKRAETRAFQLEHTESTEQTSAEKMPPKWKSPQRGRREPRLALPELSDLDTPIVGVAREMSRLNEVMAQFGKSAVDPIVTGSKLLTAAKSLSVCGRKMLDFLKTIAEHCLHKRFSEDLFYHIHHLSMAAVQLDIISSVSVSSPEDRSTDEMLVKAASRLMTVTGQALRSAETAAVKGLRKPSTPEATQHVDSLAAVAGWWKGKWEEQRHLQAASSNARDELGLRRVGLHDPPSLAQLLLPSQGT